MTSISSSDATDAHGTPSEWILTWFRRKRPGVAISLASRHYDEGLLDSYGLIELIDEIETAFQVQLDFSDLRDPSTRTLQGLVDLVARKSCTGK